ncbi:DUF5916 domain-containing protein [Fulvivirgaceae bacterium BMA10]|uniref:DUF5916 domain-containing protein n=1 Tax=Splendidivirga corallicola TaxID=3051826 RepID=A0ABT8KSC6_9BACT|nr:DUF5916 domain-containing protein [Fulvivirgaceae bacterium BMA10]
MRNPLALFFFTHKPQYVFVLILIFLGVHMAGAQEQFLAKRLEKPIQFDGMVEEHEWNGFESLPLTMHQPVFEGEISEKTEIFLAYDDQYVYLAGRLYYADIRHLQSTSKKRDALEGSTDYFGLIIDSFNDNESGLSFFTTPAGLRFDASVFNDAQGDFPINLSWNTFWDVETTTTEEGWFAEMRIPFTSLRFQDNNGEVKMGITCWRYMASKLEVITFPSVRNDLGNWSLWKPSQAKDVVFQGVYSKKPTYIAPYVLGGIQQDFDLNEQESAYHRDDDFKLEAGLDLKYSLSSNFTVDLSLNPDFAQVEVDDQQVNLTRFSLFFPEKRLFFQERSGVFDFRLGGPNRLFYSRRIGIYDEGPVRIYGGARIVGRAGKWDIGFLDMQTAKIEDKASTNYGVLRLRKQAINEFSYVGGMITNQIDADGNFNTGIGLDGVFRVSQNDYFEFNFAQTYYNDVTPSPFSFSNAKLRLNWERRNIKGFGYDFSFSRVGADFDPEMGFELREDYTRYGDKLWWGWIPGEHSKLFNHQVFFRASAFIKNETLKTESSRLGIGWEFSSKSGSFGNINLTRRVEFLTEDFELSDDVVVPVGHYDFVEFEGTYNTPYSKSFSVESTLTAGTFFDGKQLLIGISPSWKVSSSLEIGANYFYNRVDFPDRSDIFLAHIARLRSTLMFNTKLSLAMFLQHNSADNVSLGNLRLRYNPREGNDFYIVFNQSLNSDRFRELPTLPTTDSRTVLVKYTYTFVTGK